MDRVVLAVHRQHRDAACGAPPPSRRARPSPALPCSRARSSCPRRSPPARRRDRRCPTRRTARCPRRDAWRRRSVLRVRRRRATARGDRAAASSPADIRRARRHVAIAIASGAYRATCSAKRATFSPAASATTRSRSGCASTTASALWPIEPVEPRSRCASSGDLQVPARTRRTRAPRTASCRSDRARRRGRESATTSPSRRRCASAATRTDRRRCRAPTTAADTSTSSGRLASGTRSRAAEHHRRGAEDQPADRPSTVFFGLMAAPAGAGRRRGRCSTAPSR